ncbi:MAG: NAD(P)/FAD-dependent oxidoreductase [Anaerolineae bacterium]|nr:NAD(P)/FAD-dependent oxidoreductase [Anaerolineae bacterium]
MTQPRVIIIGAGFGGLYAARTLADKPVDVLLIDRKNFHTFTPLLYQVATCGLDPSEIAYPVRHIFYDRPNIRFLMGEVAAIDHLRKTVSVRTSGTTQEEHYDYLIVAAGSVTNFFGNQTVARAAFVLKDLSDAVILRNHILRLFEKAAWVEDAAEKQALTTMVVVGGGPTGLETAGALFELYNYVLRQEYRHTQDMVAHVILVEASDRLLAPFPEKLQQEALRQLTSLGVEVVLDNSVQEAGEHFIRLHDGREIATHTIVWAAGVKASPLADRIGVELQRGGRVPVGETLEVIGREHIYVVGDMAYLTNPHGMPYPQMIPVAKQQGMHAAQNILRQLSGQPQTAFQYRDRGIMATIGRSRAVAWIFNRFTFTGYLAWIMWLSLHLLWLLGFRNRVSVLVGWVWNYFTFDRSVRIILEHRELEPVREPPLADQV